MEEKVFGLIGKNISYSFSRKYFSEKFAALGKPNFSYLNFDIPDIAMIHEILQTPKLSGLNVTIPYKEQIIPLLDSLDSAAERIGAVNTIKLESGRAKGFNTDYIGFSGSLLPLLKHHHKKALILGTGGASKAIGYALSQLGMPYAAVSRNPSEGQLHYDDLGEEIIHHHQIIINCTPLGTKGSDSAPDIPYHFLSEKHLAYDLVYNPPQTPFMIKSAHFGAATTNGYRMLELQAEAAWSIWNS